jgi:hypothetical protein
MNVDLYHSPSTSPSAALPSTVAWCRSGYWVEEWLPQIVTLRIAVVCAPVF